jgi:hypothetical protein
MTYLYLFFTVTIVLAALIIIPALDFPVVVFVSAFCSTVYFLRELLHSIAAEEK